MENLTSLIIGISSGVLTAGLLYMIGHFYRTSFIPWYEDRQYKGVILDGKWKGERVNLRTKRRKDGSIEKTEETEKLQITIELRQRGYQVTGLFQAKSIDLDTKTEYENFYNLKGHISDNYLILIYSPVSRKRTGLGAFVMEVREGGNQLEGCISFINESDMEIANFSNAILNRVST